MPNILISIGNSDDKLSQQEWARFIADTRSTITRAIQRAVMLPAAIHGEWFSAPDAAWQNANWCIELVEDALIYRQLRRDLRGLCEKYRQDSIAWTEGEVTFLSAHG